MCLKGMRKETGEIQVVLLVISVILWLMLDEETKVIFSF